MKLIEFVEKYPPQPPAKSPDHPDQVRQLDSEDGVVRLGSPGAASALANPRNRPGTREGRSLWVIVAEGVPAIVESGPEVRPPPLSGGLVKHSNLTGGGLASCGGECWVDATTDELLWVTGGSGRYPPRTPQQLEDAVAVLRALGYDVKCAGWSTDNDCPERTFREA